MYFFHFLSRRRQLDGLVKSKRQHNDCWKRQNSSRKKKNARSGKKLKDKKNFRDRGSSNRKHLDDCSSNISSSNWHR